MKSFNGSVLFLDRSDINTDEIIPAKYLTEISRDALAPYLMEDLELDGFDPATDIAGSLKEITPFSISGFDANLVAAGRWVDYADANF